MYNFNVNFYFKRSDDEKYLIPFHTHKCYEMAYYYAGSGYCFIENNKYDYNKNSFVIIPPLKKHNDVHMDNCKLFCLGFTTDSEKGFLSEGVYNDENRNIYNYLKLISYEFTNRKDGYISAINCLVNNIVLEIKRAETSCSYKSVEYKDIIQQAINYIDEYYLTDITLDQLANITNYSYHRFRHIFKTATGMSPKQYVINKRLEHAKYLLSNTTLSVTKIGYLCGFSGTSLFIKQIKNNMGITPIQYRKQMRSSNIFTSSQSEYEIDSK